MAGIRNTYANLWALVKGDFTDQNGFLAWVAAIAVVGGLGYIPKLRPLSIAFMSLLLLVLVLSNGGVFAKLQAFIQSGAGGRGVVPANQNSPTAPLSSDHAAINANLGAIGG
jgi:hypothetical protein